MAKVLERGDSGSWVKVLQYIVGVTPDGKFGTKTEEALKEFQKSHALTKDGICGANTWKAIANGAPILRPGSTGKYVFALETILGTMNINGIYGDNEVSHVKTYQASAKLDQDGIVGAKTWRMLFGIDTVGSQTTASNVITTNGTKTKQPVNYKQYDSRWGNIKYTKNNTYSSKQTIRNSGCGPTSMADIVATFWDKKITPKEMAALSVKHGYRTENSGTAWDYFGFVAKQYKAKKFIQTSSFETMRNCLATGGLVVVSFRPSKWTKGG